MARYRDRTQALHIFVDADACPVKDEVVRVAARHGLEVHFVANSWMRLPDHHLVRRMIVQDGPDAADDWIAEQTQAGDIVVTQDIPLASRALKKGARAIGNSGKPFTDASIGMALAMRDLNQHLRETGMTPGGGNVFTPKDRSRFLEVLEQTIQDVKRGK